MKKFYLIAWSIFALGFVFKLLHYPGGNSMLILGALLIDVHAIAFLARNFKTNQNDSLIYLSIAGINTYTLWRLMYWDTLRILGVPLVFLIPLVIALYTLVLFFKRKVQIRWPQLFLLTYLVFIVYLSTVHSYSLNYFFNLSKALNSETRDTNYMSWDTYSWFLYIAGKYQEALDANQEAQNAVKRCNSEYVDPEANNYLEVLKKHEKMIVKRNWNTFERR